jgi:hypothetical protein
MDHINNLYTGSNKKLHKFHSMIRKLDIDIEQNYNSIELQRLHDLSLFPIENMKINELELYFKLDRKQNLYLIYCRNLNNQIHSSSDDTIIDMCQQCGQIRKDEGTELTIEHIPGK